MLTVASACLGFIILHFFTEPFGSDAVRSINPLANDRGGQPTSDRFMQGLGQATTLIESSFDGKREQEGTTKKTIAVVTLLGSFCPVTKAHVRTLVAAKQFLLGEYDAFAPQKLPLPLPGLLDPVDLVVGFLCVNSGEKVAAKLASKGLPAIAEEDRFQLVKLAINDPSFHWLNTLEAVSCDVDYRSKPEERRIEIVSSLTQRFPEYNFVHYRLDGADVAVQWRSWDYASSTSRFLVAGVFPERADGNDDRSLKAVVEGMRDSQYGDRSPGSEWYDNGFCVLLEVSGLAGQSSTKARELLHRGEISALRFVLEPSVLDWCLIHGPYQYVS